MESQALQQPEREHLIQYLAIKLAVFGLPIPPAAEGRVLALASGLLRSVQEKNRLLSDYLCPIDSRIQAYLDRVFAAGGCNGQDLTLRLPSASLLLDRPGLARELSLPVDGNYFASEYVQSYRVSQGVLHNPKSDRRTTKGTFHVAEGGLPIPVDKRAVPVAVFARLFSHAMHPPEDLLRLPFLESGGAFVSLMLRPIVAPAIPGHAPDKRMETRFFAPGSLVSNLDFVESIFGNAGDPTLPENDAALDVEHWTGHTGCVILAPHLTKLTKKELGLPHYDRATERQRRDSMCWKSEDELYNDGDAFKITCRDDSGVIVTIIADNYYGYCKKEVKTQLSYAANLYGNAEEEHAGGAIAFPRYNLGDRFQIDSSFSANKQTLEDAVRLLGDGAKLHPDGYATDCVYPDIVYIPRELDMNLQEQRASWKKDGREVSIPIRPGVTYIHPSGYRVDMERHPGAPSWRLVGTMSEGTFCHKPCTVSGGGKSEISKSILDFFQFGSFFLNDFASDMAQVEEILNRDYADRFLHEKADKRPGPSRPILSPARTLGSVIKLLTPSGADYTEAYNAWVEGIPDHIKALVFIIKRFYRPEWQGNWRQYFGTDLINGYGGHELKYKGRKLIAKFLRIGLMEDGSWRTFKMRQDFVSSAKIQMEDDITASVVVPAHLLKHLNQSNPCVKLTVNCENRLFQRPDEAIHRGADRQTEADLAQPGNFLSNFEPLSPKDAQQLVDLTLSFVKYTDPMRELIEAAAKKPEGSWFSSSAHPRIVDGKPSKNPRYLQVRPDLTNPRSKYLAEVSLRLRRSVPAADPIAWPVNAVLPGRRNNPPDKAAGIRPLAVYNPVHYQELPELFMDFISSLTGKSPSTTGAGTEGALTKSPFNALNPTADLNAALVSYILTGYHGFSTAAGYVGPRYRVDHDISLLVPELWSRLNEQERDPAFLIAEGCLEPLKDFEHGGKKILASRLGYRITAEFLRKYFGRLFDSPARVFNEEMLQPEVQDLESFVDGINNIVEAQQKVAQGYLDDGSVEGAIPPLKALLHIMATGNWEGRDAHHPEVRALFTREYLLGSDWYALRLRTRQQRDIALWTRHVKSLEAFIAQESHRSEAERLGLADRLTLALRERARVSSGSYLQELHGTIGADPLYRG
jgi:hypothetical protein